MYRASGLLVLTFLISLTVLSGATAVTASQITPWFKMMGTPGDIDQSDTVLWDGNRLILVSTIYPSSIYGIYGSIMWLDLVNSTVLNESVFRLQGFGNTMPRYGVYESSTGSLYIAGRLIRNYPYANSAFMTKIDAATGRVYWTRLFNASLLGSNALSLEDLCVENGYVYATGFYMNNVAGNEDILLLKVNKTDGSLVWAKTYSRSGSQELGYKITCSNNDIYVLAEFVYAPLIHRAVILDFSSNGTYKWGRELGGNDYMELGGILYGDGLVYTLVGSEAYSTYGADLPVLTAVNATNGEIMWNKVKNDTATVDMLTVPGGIYYKNHGIYVASFDTDIVNNTSTMYVRLSLARINQNSSVEWFYALGGENFTIYPSSLQVIELQGKDIPVAAGSTLYTGIPWRSEIMFTSILLNHPAPAIYAWTGGENFSNLTVVDPTTPRNKTLVIPWYGNLTILVKDAWEDAGITNRTIPSTELYPVSNTGLQWIPGNFTYEDPDTIYGSFQYHLATANTSILLSTPYHTVGGILVPPPGGGYTRPAIGTALLAAAISLLLVLSRKTR